jgi:hypothetical protein
MAVAATLGGFTQTGPPGTEPLFGTFAALWQEMDHIEPSRVRRSVKMDVPKSVNGHGGPYDCARRHAAEQGMKCSAPRARVGADRAHDPEPGGWAVARDLNVARSARTRLRCLGTRAASTHERTRAGARGRVGRPRTKRASHRGEARRSRPRPRTGREGEQMNSDVQYSTRARRRAAAEARPDRSDVELDGSGVSRREPGRAGGEPEGGRGRSGLAAVSVAGGADR